MVSRPTYNLNHLPNLQKDLDLQKAMYLEYYVLHFPLLEYLVLDTDLSVSNAFYGDQEPEDRTYDDPHSWFNLHYDFVNAEYLKQRFGIDRQCRHLFMACTSQLDEAGVAPKAGDRILFDGNAYEIDTAKRNPESYFGHTNYAFETILAADVGNPIISN